jgi:DNA-binding NarL/FixJ family response regulator
MAIEEYSTIAIVHSSALARHGLARLLGELPDYRVVLEAAESPPLKRAVATGTKPQVVLLCLSNAQANNAATLKWCSNVLPDAHVLVLGPEPETAMLMGMLAAGAHGFRCEQRDMQHLQRVLEQVRAGALHFPATFVKHLRNVLPTPSTTVKISPKLSTRHWEFLSLLARKDRPTYSTIAKLMKVSVSMVHKYRRCLFTKFAVRSKLALVLVACDLGLGSVR